jgi:hypothetical protein
LGFCEQPKSEISKTEDRRPETERSNFGFRHKVLKLGERNQTSWQHFHPYDLYLREVKHNLNLKDNHLRDDLFLSSLFFRGFIGKAIPNSVALFQRQCSGSCHRL